MPAEKFQRPSGVRIQQRDQEHFKQYGLNDHAERIVATCCHSCLKPLHSEMLTSCNADPAFTKNEYSNWKNAMQTKKGYQKHEASDSHMEAVARYVTVPATVIDDIGDLLSERHALEKSMNRKSLLSILSNIRYLARQALPLRGDWNTETKSEENSNFNQLLNLRAQENPESIEWLGKRVETS